MVIYLKIYFKESRKKMISLVSRRLVLLWLWLWLWLWLKYHRF